jgi:hypothetical protein
MEKPNLPGSLQLSVNLALEAFRNGNSNPESLKHVYEWLEVEGWDDLIGDLGEQLAINLGRLSHLKFNDYEARYYLDVPDDEMMTDQYRVAWGRMQIDRVLSEYDEYLLPSLHTYQIYSDDGNSAVIGCLVEIHGQAGPVCQWQGLWNTRDEFLAAVGDGKSYWVTPLMGDVPDTQILELWQKPKGVKKRSKKRANNA